MPGRATISRIIRNAEKYLGADTLTVKSKFRERKGANHPVEKSLYAWICDQEDAKRSIDGPMIMLQARKLQMKANQRLPEEKRIHLEFSDGWLQNFKARWGLRL